MGEFELIDRIRRRAGQDGGEGNRDLEGVVLGIGDDAAVLASRPGTELVVTTDTLVMGRHFTERWPIEAIGRVAAESNLSDLAAMGATPRWALLALTLPEDDAAWLDAFLDGFLAAASDAGLALVGGNLARGPLNVGVELIGEVACGRAVTRGGARAGDRLVVTGTVGDAAAALALEAPGEALLERLYRPSARVAAGRALAEHARAMIDLSDGLLADLGHLLDDGLGARIELAALPASPALRKRVVDERERWRLQTGGGSDYELLAVLPGQGGPDVSDIAGRAGVALTEIGRITDDARMACLDGRGVEVDLNAPGWDHFDGR